jgi:hypothetical protein
MELFEFLFVMLILGIVGFLAKPTVDKNSADHAVFEEYEKWAAAILKWALILGLPGALLVWYVWAHS